MRNPRLWIWFIVAALGVALTVGLIMSGSSDQANQPPKKERGVTSSAPPWPVETTHLQERLEGIDYPLTPGTEKYHIHSHLDLALDGKMVTVPANVGLNPASGVMSPLHTHDETGVIHIEADNPLVAKLGDFFTVWGVAHGVDQLGSFRSTDKNSIRLFVNGKLQSGDWQNYAMQSHDELYLFYGPKEAPVQASPSYQFPSGE